MTARRFTKSRGARGWVRPVAVAAVAATALGAGWAAYGAGETTTSTYRTATVTVADVEETLVLSGTVSAAGRRDLAFGTSGRVTQVLVEQGEKVRAGQALVRLESTALQRDVARARADLASARAQLAADQAAQAETVTEAASASGTTSSAQTSSAQSSSALTTSALTTSARAASAAKGEETEQSSVPDEVTEALAKLAEQQLAVTSAQTKATEALAAGRSALATQQEVCAAAFEPADDPDPAAAENGTEAAAEDSTEADDACTLALDAVQAAQSATATAQDELQAAIDVLATTLTEAVAALQDSGTSSTPDSEQPSESPSEGQPSEQPSGQPSGQPNTATPSGQPSGQPSTGQSSEESSSPQLGSSSGTVTAGTLARDQASIDQARADLLAAQQALAAATLRAPVAGTVRALDAAVGEQVVSGTTVAVLLPRGAATVELSVDADQLRSLEVGQVARVTPTGAQESLEAEVAALSAVPDTSSGSATYAVTVALQRKAALPLGGAASVSIVTGTAEDVLTVPTSAVSVATGSVQLYASGTATRQQVGVGIVGGTRVEITEGLSEGDKVVLADLDAALPSSDAESESGGFGGSGLGGRSGLEQGPPSGLPPMGRG